MRIFFYCKDRSLSVWFAGKQRFDCVPSILSAHPSMNIGKFNLHFYLVTEQNFEKTTLN